MIFTCCHPSLNVAAQIALTLKTLCGFGIKEIANAFLTSESTINKRLYRAKKSIRDSALPFQLPQGKELEARLDTVMLTLYLLFNEGYNSASGDKTIQKELCLEAIRLSKLLSDHFTEAPQLSALLSLMCFHTARFEARIDKQGAIVLFEDQDRSRWNTTLIHKGMHYLRRSMASQQLSAYHLEASIAAEHCMAESFEVTDWQSIYHRYTLLEKLKPNPIIQLNLAIIESKLKGIEQALISLEKLSKNPVLHHYYLLPATQGIFYFKLQRFEEAVVFLQAAQKLNPSPTEYQYLSQKIEACQRQLSKE